MSLTINTKPYANDMQVSANAQLYAGPQKTLSSKDDVVLSRTAPKPTLTYAGTARAEYKLTRSFVLADESRVDAIFVVQSAFPVGIAGADAEAMIDDTAAWLATSAASQLFLTLKVNQ